MKSRARATTKRPAVSSSVSESGITASATRHAYPTVPLHYVARTDLERRLKRAIRTSPLVLVSGTPGSGKTTLVGRVLGRLGSERRFWYFGALDRNGRPYDDHLMAEFAKRTTFALAHPLHETLVHVVDELARDASELAPRYVIVDDVDVLPLETAATLARSIAAHASRVRWVLVGRTFFDDPILRSFEFRVGGLLEGDARELLRVASHDEAPTFAPDSLVRNAPTPQALLDWIRHGSSPSVQAFADALGPNAQRALAQLRAHIGPMKETVARRVLGIPHIVRLMQHGLAFRHGGFVYLVPEARALMQWVEPLSPADAALLASDVLACGGKPLDALRICISHDSHRMVAALLDMYGTSLANLEGTHLLDALANYTPTLAETRDRIVHLCARAAARFPSNAPLAAFETSESPMQPDALLELAQAHMFRGNPAEAQRLLQGLLEQSSAVQTAPIKERADALLLQLEDEFGIVRANASVRPSSAPPSARACLRSEELLQALSMKSLRELDVEPELQANPSEHDSICVETGLSRIACSAILIERGDATEASRMLDSLAAFASSFDYGEGFHAACRAFLLLDHGRLDDCVDIIRTHAAKNASRSSPHKNLVRLFRVVDLGVALQCGRPPTLVDLDQEEERETEAHPLASWKRNLEAYLLRRRGCALSFSHRTPTGTPACAYQLLQQGCVLLLAGDLEGALFSALRALDLGERECRRSIVFEALSLIEDIHFLGASTTGPFSLTDKQRHWNAPSTLPERTVGGETSARVLRRERRARALTSNDVPLDLVDEWVVSRALRTDSCGAHRRSRVAWTVDETTRCVYLPRGRIVDLKSKPLLFQLLRVVAEQIDGATKETLALRAWGLRGYLSSRDDKRIHVAVRTLRTLLEPDTNEPVSVLTTADGYRLGKGYCQPWPRTR